MIEKLCMYRNACARMPFCPVHMHVSSAQARSGRPCVAHGLRLGTQLQLSYCEYNLPSYRPYCTRAITRIDHARTLELAGCAPCICSPRTYSGFEERKFGYRKAGCESGWVIMINFANSLCVSRWRQYIFEGVVLVADARPIFPLAHNTDSSSSGRSKGSSWRSRSGSPKRRCFSMPCLAPSPRTLTGACVCACVRVCMCACPEFVSK